MIVFLIANTAPNISGTPAEITVRVGVTQLIELYIVDENNNLRDISIQAYPIGQTLKLSSLPQQVARYNNGSLTLSWTPNEYDVTGFSVIATDQLGLSTKWDANIRVCKCAPYIFAECNFTEYILISRMSCTYIGL